MNLFFQISLYSLGTLAVAEVVHFRRRKKGLRRLSQLLIPVRKSAPVVEDVPAPVDPPVFITSLEDISLRSWIIASCDHDYSVVTISGTPTAGQLRRGWLRLMSDYCDLTGSQSAIKYVDLVSKIDAITTKIDMVETLIAALRSEYSPDLCDCLRELGYDRPYTVESYEVDIDRVELLLGNLRTRLAMAEKEYEDLQADDEANESTKEGYMRSLYTLEQFVNRSGGRLVLTPEEMNMYKYALLCKELSEYNKDIANQQKQHES